MTTMTTAATIASEMLAERPTSELFDMLSLLDAIGRANRTPEEHTTRAWIIDAIEARYPAVNALMDAWADGARDGMTYAEALAWAVAEVTK